MKYVFLDTETTHLDPELGQLWEVALIVRHTHYPSLGDQEFWWQVRPDLTTADPKSLQISRYYSRNHQIRDLPIGHGAQLACASGDEGTEGEVMEVVTAAQVALRLAQHLDGATIVANNPRHDRDFLHAFLHANGQAFTASHRMDDIRSMLKGYVYGRLAAHGGEVQDAFLPDAAAYVHDWLIGAMDVLAWEIVGVSQAQETKHTALGDTRCVRDVFDGITKGNHE